MHLYVIYPVVLAFGVAFLAIGCATSAGACSPDLAARLETDILDEDGVTRPDGSRVLITEPSRTVADCS